MPSMVRLRCVALLSIAGAALGCQTNDLDWEIRIEPAALRDRVARLDARIVRGDCTSSDVVWDETIHPTRPTRDVPELDEDTWCFEARAGDASCSWIAEGSTRLDLPYDVDGPVVVVLAETAPAPNCTATCMAGLCSGGGTGSGDCTGDMTCAPRCDAAPCAYGCTDSSRCTPDCTEKACSVTCDASASCNITCPGGSCAVVCDGSADCIVDCAGGVCDLTCRGAADCDFRCAGGFCTFACEGTGTCATDCTGGVCEGP